MKKRNPYEAIENLGGVLIICLAAVCAITVLIAAPIGIMWPAWGWWAIFAAPISWVGWALIGGFFWTLESGSETLGRRWASARENWDAKNGRGFPQGETEWS